MVVEGTVTSDASHLTHDPYTKVTDKARKLIESVERKIGSTGGTDGSTLLVDQMLPLSNLNVTAQNFYSINTEIKRRGNGKKIVPSMQI